MKRFVFSLEQVLRFKQQVERVAEQRQKQAAWKLQSAEAEAAALRSELDRAAGSLQSWLNQAIGSGSWLAHYEHSAYLGQAVARAEQQVEQASQALQQANAQRRQIAIEVEALLFLRQQEWQAHRQAAQRAQQEVLDEIGLRRWQEGRDGA